MCGHTHPLYLKFSSARILDPSIMVCRINLQIVSVSNHMVRKERKVVDSNYGVGHEVVTISPFEDFIFSSHLDLKLHPSTNSGIVFLIHTLLSHTFRHREGNRTFTRKRTREWSQFSLNAARTGNKRGCHFFSPARCCSCWLGVWVSRNSNPLPDPWLVVFLRGLLITDHE